MKCDGIFPLWGEDLHSPKPGLTDEAVVLVVIENPITRTHISDKFYGLGHRVVEAGDFIEARDLLRGRAGVRLLLCESDDVPPSDPTSAGRSLNGFSN